MPGVQIFERGPTRSSLISQQLANALGMGIEGYQQGKQMSQQRAQQGQLAQALFGNNPEMMQQFQSLPPEQQLKAYELMNKPPPGGISAQSVPPEVSQAIPEIINANKEANADELAIAFDKAGIPRAYSNSYIENRRRQDEAKSKKETKASEVGRKEQLEFHKESQKYDEKLTTEADAGNKQLKSIQRQRELIPQIKKKDRIISALFAGTKMENLVKSKDAQEFDSLVLPMIEGKKETFGVRLSDADLRLVLQKIATSEKDPEANKAILDWQELEAKMAIDKRKIADEIRKDNEGLRPLDFQSQIRDRLEKKYGDEIQEKTDAIMSLKDDPESEARIVERKKVPSGTPLDTKSIDRYLKLSNNDPNKAAEMAREDGYEF